MTTFTAILLTIIILGLALWLLKYVFTSPHSMFDRQQYNEDQVCKMQQAMLDEYAVDTAHCATDDPTQRTSQ